MVRLCLGVVVFAKASFDGGKGFGRCFKSSVWFGDIDFHGFYIRFFLKTVYFISVFSFALFTKSAKERFALSLFSKRATKSESLFRSFQKKAKERTKERIALFFTFLLFLKSKCSFFALFKEKI